MSIAQRHSYGTPVYDLIKCNVFTSSGKLVHFIHQLVLLSNSTERYFKWHFLSVIGKSFFQTEWANSWLRHFRIVSGTFMRNNILLFSFYQNPRLTRPFQNMFQPRSKIIANPWRTEKSVACLLFKTEVACLQNLTRTTAVNFIRALAVKYQMKHESFAFR